MYSCESCIHCSKKKKQDVTYDSKTKKVKRVVEYDQLFCNLKNVYTDRLLLCDFWNKDAKKEEKCKAIIHQI